MRTGLLSAISVVLLASCSFAQVPTHVRSATSLSATCNPGNGVTAADMIAIWNGSVATYYVCTASNTWTALMAGTQYPKLRCETGLGDGLNAMTAGTYLQSFCYNDSGVTWTITGIRCLTDNNGTSTLNASNGASTGLLTGAVTCTNAWAAGTQSATLTIAAGDYVKFTFVSDGASKQTSWAVTITQ